MGTEAYSDRHVVDAVSVFLTMRLLHIHPLRTAFDHRYLQRVLLKCLMPVSVTRTSVSLSLNLSLSLDALCG
jgi:hypothetical protein